MAKRWTPQELDTIKRNYLTKGANACARLLPNTSPYQVKKAAAKLGLHRPPRITRSKELTETLIADHFMSRDNEWQTAPEVAKAINRSHRRTTAMLRSLIDEGTVEGRGCNLNRAYRLALDDLPSDHLDESTKTRLAELREMINALPDTETAPIYRAELERRMAQLEDRYA